MKTTDRLDSPDDSGTDDDPRVVAAVKEYEEQLRQGQRPDRKVFLERHSDVATILADCLDALEMVHGAVPQSQPAPLPPMPSLERLGDYRIVRVIGRGGMGVVYEAVQESLGRQVALKVLPPQTAQQRTSLERFRREAQAAAVLHHTNIVPVFGVGEQDGIPYYAMQFIDGVGLDVVLHRPRESGAEHYRTIARLAMQAAHGLEYAHRQGVLHRDVKPSNLLLDSKGTVWIADFGLARVEGADDLTDTGGVVGTLRYLAPERFRGDADPRSDVYSLGLTLYELLTQRPAFPGTDRLQLVEQITQHAPPRPRQLDRHIPRDLETVVLKAMDREPARRYQTAGEMAGDLRSFLDDRPIRARPLGLLGRLAKWARRHPAVAALSGLLLTSILVLVLLAGWSYWRIGRALADKEVERRTAVAAQEEEQKARAAAEKDAYRSLLGATRLLRLVHESGWRQEALENLRRLRQMPTPERNLLELRNEAVACLSDLDVAPAGRLPLQGTRSSLWSMDFSPDGKQFVGVNQDGAFVWEVPSGQVRREVQLPDAALIPRGSAFAAGVAAQFGRDGRCLTYIANDARVRTVALQEGDVPLRPLEGREGPRALAHDRERRRVAVAWGTGIGAVYDTSTGQSLCSIAGTAPIALSPDGRRFATIGARPGLVQVQRVDERTSMPLANHGFGTLTAMAFGADSKLLAVAAGKVARIWSADAQREVAWLQAATVDLSSIAFSPDGQYLLTGALEPRPTLRLWSTRTWQPVFTLRPRTGTRAAFSPDGAWLAVDDPPEVVLYPLGDRPGRLRLIGHDSRIGRPTQVAIAAHPREPLLASGGPEGGAVIWDLTTGRVVRRWSSADATIVSGVRFSPTGDLLAVATARYTGGMEQDLEVLAYDTATGETRWKVHARSRQAFNALAFDPAGKALAACTPGGGTTCLWQVPTGEALHQWPEPRATQLRLAGFVSNGTNLVRTMQLGQIELLDVKTGEVRLAARLPGKGAPTSVLLQHPERLALLDHTGMLHVRTLPGCEEAQPPRRVAPSRGTLAFSPDGRLVAVAGWDGDLDLWDAQTWEKLISFPSEDRVLSACHFAGGGRYLAVSGQELHVTVYDLARLHEQLADLGLAENLPLP